MNYVLDMTDRPITSAPSHLQAATFVDIGDVINGNIRYKYNTHKGSELCEQENRDV